MNATGGKQPAVLEPWGLEPDFGLGVWKARPLRGVFAFPPCGMPPDEDCIAAAALDAERTFVHVVPSCTSQDLGPVVHNTPLNNNVDF